MKKPVLYSLWTLTSLLFFLWLLFPGAFAESLIEAYAHGKLGRGVVDVAGVHPALPVGLAMDGVTMDLPQGAITARDVRVTPAWLTVMTLKPGGRLNAVAFGGHLTAEVRTGYTGGGWRRLTGQMEAMDLATLSPFLEGMLPVAVSLTGQGAGTLALAREGEGTASDMTGSAEINLSDVGVAISDTFFPVKKLSFAAVSADMAIKGRTLTLDRLYLEGSEVDAELKGRVILDRRMASSRIDITGILTLAPDFVKALSKGLPLAMLVDPNVLKRGRIPIRIGGTLGSPRISLK